MSPSRSKTENAGRPAPRVQVTRENTSRTGGSRVRSGRFPHLESSKTGWIHSGEEGT